MAILTKDQANIGKQALENPMGGDGSFREPTIDALSYLPDFMPEELASTALCNSQEELDRVTAALTAFKEVVALTKKKYGLQLKAAEYAYELTKSKNAMISTFGKVLIKQNQSDSDTMAAIAALPRMIAGIKGGQAAKTEKIVANYTERLRNAAQPRTEGSTGKKK